MLTARDAVMDKVSGLDAGADDYITKPFAIEELLARIRTALKKRVFTVKKDEDVIRCGLLTLDKMRHKVMYGDTEIELTNREFTLLQILMKNKNPTGIFWIFYKKILWEITKEAVRDENCPERLTENS